MKYGLIAGKVVVTLLAFIISAGVAEHISVDIMGKISISLIYFYALFLPMATLIWMKYIHIKSKLIRASVAIVVSAIGLVAMTMYSKSIGYQNPGLASTIFGGQSIMLVIVYAWLWGELRRISKRIVIKL